MIKRVKKTITKKRVAKKTKGATIDDLALMVKRGFDGIREELKTEIAGNRFEIVGTKSEIKEVKSDIDDLKNEVRFLRDSIDKFIVFYERQKQEFMIVKNELKKIKEVLKTKLGVDINSLA